MNVGQLKKILEGMADDALVFARDRDSIGLDMVHVVNHPTVLPKLDEDKYSLPQKEYGGARFVESINQVYGGDSEYIQEEVNGTSSKQAIIFCDCD